MKLKHLIFLLILMFIMSIISYYYALMSEEMLEKEIRGRGKQEVKQFVIRETAQEVIEEVEGGEEEIVISDETPAKEEKIEILFNIFSPKTLTIKEGTRVEWMNKDNNVHQLKELSTDHLFRSNRINPGDSYSFTFTKAGEYKYIDTIYTYMSGKIIVEENALGIITGNVVGFSKNPANPITLLLFIALGFALIYGVETYKEVLH